MLSLLSVWLVLGVQTPSAQPPAADRVLVVPFENAQKEPRIGWLSEAAAVLLADELNARGVACHPPARARAGVRAIASAADRLAQPGHGHQGRSARRRVRGRGRLLPGRERSVDDRGAQHPHRRRASPAGRGRAGADRGSVRSLSARGRQAVVWRGAASREAAAGLAADTRGVRKLHQGSDRRNGGATQATFLEPALKEHPGFDRARLALWDVRDEQGDHSAALAPCTKRASGLAVLARGRVSVPASR